MFDREEIAWECCLFSLIIPAWGVHPLGPPLLCPLPCTLGPVKRQLGQLDVGSVLARLQHIVFEKLLKLKWMLDKFITHAWQNCRGPSIFFLNLVNIIGFKLGFCTYVSKRSAIFAVNLWFFFCLPAFWVEMKMISLTFHLFPLEWWRRELGLPRTYLEEAFQAPWQLSSINGAQYILLPRWGRGRDCSWFVWGGSAVGKQGYRTDGWRQFRLFSCFPWFYGA